MSVNNRRTKRKGIMNDKFDELARRLAQSVTRRQAFKRFGVGLAGMVLACFGVANKTEAGNSGSCLPKGSICAPGVFLPCCKGHKCVFTGVFLAIAGTDSRICGPIRGLLAGLATEMMTL
jgi:hypothetical protein